MYLVMCDPVLVIIIIIIIAMSIIIFIGISDTKCRSIGKTK